MRTTTRRIAVPLVVLALIAIGTTIADAASKDDKPAANSAWQPPDEDRSAFRDIIDYNIFNADRRRIAERVDRERNPPEPRKVVTADPDPVVETPVDPDTLYRLSGISHDPQGPVAYIEHTATGELSRIQGPSDFSQGKITVIGYERLVYVVEDDHRSVSIGQNLTGKSASPAGVSSGSTTGTGDADAPKPGSREAILRAMRERRERELGKGQPATPQPDPTPETPESPESPEATETTEQPPSEQTEPSSGQTVPAGNRSASPDANNQ